MSRCDWWGGGRMQGILVLQHNTGWYRYGDSGPAVCFWLTELCAWHYATRPRPIQPIPSMPTPAATVSSAFAVNLQKLVLLFRSTLLNRVWASADRQCSGSEQELCLLSGVILSPTPLPAINQLTSTPWFNSCNGCKCYRLMTTIRAILTHSNEKIKIVSIALFLHTIQ